jgi:Ion channel
VSLLLPVLWGYLGPRVAVAEGTGPGLMSPSGPRERRVDKREPAYRFGIVLLLLFATFAFLASGPTGNWVALVAVVLQGATLLAALSASGAGRALWRLAVLVVLVGLASATAALFFGVKNVSGPLFLLSLLLVGAAPVVIVRSLLRRRVIDVQTVLGALCVYVLLGMFWSFAFAAIGTLGSDPFFSQQRNATVADYLYFSFVTQTTVGYGDFTAAGGLGRVLAVLEALIGQLYLVTVIALLVSNLGRRGRAS